MTLVLQSPARQVHLFLDTLKLQAGARRLPAKSACLLWNRGFLERALPWLSTATTSRSLRRASPSFHRPNGRVVGIEARGQWLD